MPGVDTRFSKEHQPSKAARQAGRDKKIWKKYILDAICGGQLDMFLSNSELLELWDNEKIGPHDYQRTIQKYKKQVISEMIARNLVRYMLLNKKQAESKNTLEVFKVFGHNILDDIKDQMEVNITLAENETLDCEKDV